MTINPKYFDSLASKKYETFMYSVINILATKIQIYEANKCVICLEIDDGLDLLYYQCGHKCCHYKCGKLVDKCPLCRQHITAYIKQAI